MKRFIAIVLALTMLASSVGCVGNDTSSPSSPVISSQGTHSVQENNGDELVLDYSTELVYAKNFSVDYFKGGYKLITVFGKGKFLTVPEGKEAPKNIEQDVVVLQMPITNMLISSAPTMSLIAELDALDCVTQTTTDADGWYIESVKSAMNEGAIDYVGDYKDPDYEKILANKPKLAVFSAMLDSAPEVAAKLRELEIPYILDQSTYEEHPLARVEWVKLYGALFNKEKEAEEVFKSQMNYVDSLDIKNIENKTAAIFYITSKGVLYARQAGDYLTKMLELAGGKYIFEDLNPTKTGTQKMDFETFYNTAKDADYIVYIWSVGGKPNTLDDFIALNGLFSEFKAVKDGNVWCTTPDFFQISNSLGYMIKDLNEMLTLQDKNINQLTYLFRLK